MWRGETKCEFINKNESSQKGYGIFNDDNGTVKQETETGHEMTWEQGERKKEIP